MGWGNIGMSWTRYAKGTPVQRCERCHQEHVVAAGKCLHCSHLDDPALRQFMREQETSKQNSNKLFMALIMMLVLYVVVILFVLPA